MRDRGQWQMSFRGVRCASLLLRVPRDGGGRLLDAGDPVAGRDLLELGDNLGVHGADLGTAGVEAAAAGGQDMSGGLPGIPVRRFFSPVRVGNEAIRPWV